jgi:hypothetical protein
LSWGQGDQIGLIFAHWAIVFFWPVFLKITEVTQITGVAQYFGLLISTVFVLIMSKNGLGYILGDFFSQTHLVPLAGCKIFLWM